MSGLSIGIRSYLTKAFGPPPVGLVAFLLALLGLALVGVMISRMFVDESLVPGNAPSLAGLATVAAMMLAISNRLPSTTKETFYLSAVVFAGLLCLSVYEAYESEVHAREKQRSVALQLSLHCMGSIQSSSCDDLISRFPGVLVDCERLTAQQCTAKVNEIYDRRRY